MKENVDTANLILGAIAGDIIGSVYEFHNVKRTDFDLFTPKTTFTGDSDTLACITGGIAEAYYKATPGYIIENILKILPAELAATVAEFSTRYR